MVFALYEIRWRARHVVPQVVESKFVVGAVGDVRQVGFPALLAVGLVSVDAIHSESVELEQRSHPLRVTSRQVIVDRDHMHSLSR